MEQRLTELLPRLRQYLAGPASAEGLLALFEQHGLVLVSEDQAEYMDQCAYEDLLQWPAASQAVN